jgi:hypothetical protein
MKKRSIAILLVASNTAFAGNMGPICVGQSTAPCENSAFSIGGQALYLQPRYSGANLLGTVANAGIAGDPSNLIYQNANDAWRWGFKIEGAYLFYTGNDLNLNWSHISGASNTKTINFSATSSFADNVQNDYATSPVFTSRNPTWDAANAEFGQRVNFGDRSNIRFHGGVQYSRINTFLSFSSPNSVGSTTYATQTLTYNGFGPRVGLDMTYNWRNNFAMYATGATALLIGPNQFNDLGFGSNDTTWQSLSGSTTAIVPDIEAKLGIKYTYAMAPGDLIFDLGWMWNNYFNSQINSSGLVGGSGQGGTQQSDFGLQGLYFGLKWLGNLA